MPKQPDEIENRVNKALRTYKANPGDATWQELTLAVEHLKADRQGWIEKSNTPSAAFDQFTESVSQEAGRAAEAVEQEATRLTGSAKIFIGDVKSAFDRLLKGS